MKLYQPVLFVGLGGSGCDIGAVVERRLREEICGPDGTEFPGLRSNAGMLPYQLPKCVQFVYADLNQTELDRLPRRVVLSALHVPAAQQTAHYSGDLVPMVPSYQHLAVQLRMDAEPETRPWLPPRQGEPRVSPLTKGAAQLPTVGRAALFGTFLHSLSPAVRDIREAVGKLATSGTDLAAMGGRALHAVDVFVAFSVAGGTGGGIFYDYLHLIGQVFREAKLQAKVYPLVLMPSAFAEGLGGGRYAQLNAGRALLDLFRLVDHQNAGDAERDLQSEHERRPLKAYEQAVRYPSTGKMTLEPGTVQTAFLFALPVGATKDDLHRSIGALVLSLVGTEFEPEEVRSGESPQSFADWWINSGNDRQAPAENGIGNRGVSTALVASMTVPFDDLAAIIGGRLLREAIYQLYGPVNRAEANQEHIGRFLGNAGVQAVMARDGVQIAEPQPGHGAREVAGALNERAEAMKRGIEVLVGKLRQEVPQHVGNLEPRRAIREMLATADLYRVQRVAFGHPELERDLDKIGAAGLLRNRRISPQRPEGIELTPASALHMKKRVGRLRWTDPEPVAVQRRQNAWYQWRTHVAWAEAWGAHAGQWQRTLADADAELASLTKALLDFAHADESKYGQRVAELYRHRVGVSYLLPLGGTEMEQFYIQVRQRLIEDLATDGRVQPAATEAGLVQALIGASGGWLQAYNTSLTRNAEQAVTDLRDQVKEHVQGCLRDASGGRRPLLPRLHDLLGEAAGVTTGRAMLRDYMDEFRNKLAGLVPGAFAPQGTGSMKVLISYPAEAANPAVERYLREWLTLPAAPNIVYDMKHTQAESITVVLFRSSMGVSEVDEVRDVLRLWAQALGQPEPADFLRWRQRTSYEFGYLATTAEHRVEILHRLLCALWNGKVTVEGDESSPSKITVELGGEVRMNLQLTKLERASSWASVLRAYELWALDNDDIRRRFCAQLMRERPDGLAGDYRAPDPLYLTVVNMAEDQAKLLGEMIEQQAPGHRARAEQAREFWAQTMLGALDREFTEIEAPAQPSLRELQRVAAIGGES